MAISLSTNGGNAHWSSTPPTRLLVATAKGVSILERGGAGRPWELTGRTLEGLHVSALAIDADHGRVYAGVHGGGLYRSDDEGASWQRKTNGLTVEHVFSLRVENEGGRSVVYAGTEPVALFRSTDDGDSWTELPAIHQVPNMEKWTFPGPPHIAHTKTIAVDPRDPKVMYVGVEQGGLLKTEDGGQSWRELEAYYHPDDMWYRDIHQVRLRPSNPDELFMTTGIGFYHSPDRGLTWRHVTGPESRIGYPDQLVFSPHDDSLVFMSGARRDPMTWRKAGMADATIIRSRDAGKTWQEAGRGLPDSMRHNIEAMCVAGYPGGFALFIGDTGGNLYCSEDQAESWTQVLDGLAPISKGGHYLAFQPAVA